MSTRYDNDQQTIIAQCTPQGTGSLALLRLSGIDAFEVADHFCKPVSKRPISELATHTVSYGTVINANNETIDRVMFIVMRGPKTFTGQDTVEITCHNNQFIVEAIIEQAISYGARLAQGGEFSRRSYLNNKIDLIQAEAINELIHANTQMALKKSLAQLEGTFSQWITTIEQELLKALALSDASFEFIDEEIGFQEQIIEVIEKVINVIASIKKTFNQQQHIRQGVRIALIGSVNAGKSSLFNSILNRNRAIVTEVAGTTRDVLEAGLYRDGAYWTLIDTAGLRKTNNAIEQQGIAKAHEEAKAADIILLVIDSSRIMTEQEKKIYDELRTQYQQKIILVHNKNDLPSQLAPATDALLVSSLEKETTFSLEKEIEKKVKTLFENIESPFLLNQRQFNLVLALEKSLNKLQKMLQKTAEYELISYELKDALSSLTELTGRSISEEGMDTVFRSFCVGK
jgi:tRNA modification GTPase